MDPWQLKRQLAEKILPAVVWEDSPGAVVLTGGAVVSEDEAGNFIPREAFLVDGPATRNPPFAVVSTGSVAPDPGLYGRIAVRLMVWVVAGGGGITKTPVASSTGQDTHGANQVTGTIRDPVSGQGKSTGREVDEVCFRLLESLNRGLFNISDHGFQGLAILARPAEPVSGVQFLARPIEIIVYSATVSRTYDAPRSFTASSAGGSVSLAWNNPPARFDTYQNVLRRGTNPGDAAPAIPTDGTGIAITGGVLGTSATDAGHVAGQRFNYALFHVYSEVTAGDRYSVAVTKGVTVA